MIEGVHQGTVTITAANATPLVVPITVTVYAEPSIGVDPVAFDLNYGAATGPHVQNLAIWNGGSGTLNFTVSPSETWLTVSPNVGSSTAVGDSQSIQITLETQGLTLGDHLAQLVFSSTQPGVADVTLPVTVHLISEPLIGFTPASLTLTLTLGVGDQAVQRELQIWNAGTGILNYQLSAEVPWLLFSAVAGDSTGLGDVDLVQLTFQNQFMVIGGNTGLITITAGQSGGPSQNLPVNVTLVADELSAVGRHWHREAFCDPPSGNLADVSHFVIYINNNFACQTK